MSLLSKVKIGYERLPSEEPFRKIVARVRKKIQERLKRRELEMTPQEKRKNTVMERYGGFHAIGVKARETNLERYGEGFYGRIGKVGGQNGNTGGFASPERGSDGLTGYERASIAGKKGGEISRRIRKGARNVEESTES